MVMQGNQFIEMKSLLQLKNQMEQLGFKIPFRILDAFTILHTSKGTRLFPFSIQQIYKQVSPDGQGGEWVSFFITTRERDKGFVIYPANSTEARLCEAFCDKCRQAFNNGTTLNQ